MLKAIGYIRVSTEEQKKGGVSLKAQEEKIKKYAEWKGMECDIFKEGPVSGSSLLVSRPKGETLLDLIEAGAVTDIIVTKLDRLFRDLKDCVINIEDWEETVVVHLVDEGGIIDTSTPDGYLNVMVKALFASYEVRVIRHRTRAALRHKKGSGEVYNGNPPYGYRAENGMLVRDKIEQDRIALIKSMRNNRDMTLQGIADELNGNGFMSKKGGNWFPATIKAVLDFEGMEV